MDGSDAVDMRVGEVLALQWLSNSDVVNFNVNTQTRIAELSKVCVVHTQSVQVCLVCSCSPLAEHKSSCSG